MRKLGTVLVTRAPMGRSFPHRLERAKAVFAVQFPGYGARSFGERPLAQTAPR